MAFGYSNASSSLSILASTQPASQTQGQLSAAAVAVAPTLRHRQLHSGAGSGNLEFLIWRVRTQALRQLMRHTLMCRAAYHQDRAHVGEMLRIAPGRSVGLPSHESWQRFVGDGMRGGDPGVSYWDEKAEPSNMCIFGSCQRLGNGTKCVFASTK